MLPPDTDRFNFLFDTAVQRSALSTDDTLAVVFAAGKAAVTRRSLMELSDESAPPPASPATGGRGGFGGGGGMGGGWGCRSS